MLGEPALQLVYRDQSAAADPDDAQLGKHVVFEEVDADAERLGGLGLGESEASCLGLLGARPRRERGSAGDSAEARVSASP